MSMFDFLDTNYRYLEGLKQVVSTNNEYSETANQLIHFYFHNKIIHKGILVDYILNDLFRLFNVYDYVRKYKLLDLWIDNLLIEQPTDDTIRLTGGEIYDIIEKISNYQANKIIRLIRSNNATLVALIKAYEEKNKEQFEKYYNASENDQIVVDNICHMVNRVYKDSITLSLEKLYRGDISELNWKSALNTMVYTLDNPLSNIFNADDVTYKNNLQIVLNNLKIIAENVSLDNEEKDISESDFRHIVDILTQITALVVELLWDKNNMTDEEITIINKSFSTSMGHEILRVLEEAMRRGIQHEQGMEVDTVIDDVDKVVLTTHEDPFAHTWENVNNNISLRAWLCAEYFAYRKSINNDEKEIFVEIATNIHYNGRKIIWKGYNSDVYDVYVFICKGNNSSMTLQEFGNRFQRKSSEKTLSDVRVDKNKSQRKEFDLEKTLMSFHKNYRK